MTPLDLARSLAASDRLDDRIHGAAIVARSLSDDDPSDPTRRGYTPESAALAALSYLGLSEDLFADVLVEATRIPDHVLNAPTLGGRVTYLGDFGGIDVLHVEL